MGPFPLLTGFQGYVLAMGMTPNKMVFNFVYYYNHPKG